ncbi:MAG TPA: hypothetical protein VGV85_12155 [Longimicrobiaceae bacterium]|nr:hypothetical protein [Longimicrobiaceae bacterium]
MPELAGVDLEDSWVLGWRYDAPARRLTIEVEASLWPGHPAYEPPAAGEHTCYRRATLAFEGVTSVSGLRTQSEVPGHLDPDGTRDYGSVDVLEGADGVFRLAGEMGEVTVRAAVLRLRLAGAVPPAG